MNGGRALLIGQPVWERAHQPERRATFKDRKPRRRRQTGSQACTALLLLSSPPPQQSRGGGNTLEDKPGEDGGGGMVTDGEGRLATLTTSAP